MPTTRHPTNYGGLLLRGDIWHMRFSIKGETVAESTHTSNRRDAERILAKRKAELVEQVVLGGKKPIKLHDAIDLFVKSRAHMPSAQNAEIHIRYFKQLPNNNLDRITDAEIEDVISKKRAEGYKESTLKVSVTYFNAMIRYVSDHGYTARKKIKPIKHDSTRLRWLTKDELNRLLAALDPNLSKDPVTQAQKQENLDLIKLLYYTGARLTEISDMHWNQVDIVAGTVFIKRNKGSVSGTIGMTAAMKEIFERRRKMDKEDHVFPMKVGKANNKWMKAAVKRAGLSEADGSVSIHTLRHTTAVHLLQGGMNLLELQKFLGHRTIQSTLVYAKVIQEDVTKKAVSILDAV